MYTSKEEFRKIIDKYKYNLEDISKIHSSVLLKMINKYYAPSLKSGEPLVEGPYVDINILIKSMHPALIAPAYHYNNYLEHLYFDSVWDEIKYEIPENEWLSMGLREAIFIADMQSVISSIKMCLDRLVTIFSYYYRGVSTDTTFGHFKESGKATGLLGIAVSKAADDALMDFFVCEYKEWISTTVGPRDIITHYNDLSTVWVHNSEWNVLLPKHISTQFLNKTKGNYEFDFKLIKERCERLYNFYTIVCDLLIKKEIIIQTARI